MSILENVTRHCVLFVVSHNIERTTRAGLRARLTEPNENWTSWDPRQARR